MKLGIRYRTKYTYDEAVGFAPHEIRLFPRGDNFCHVRRLDFKTNPAANVRFGRDVFDNVVAACHFPERATELQLQLAIDLDLSPKDPFHFLLERDAVDLPFVYNDALKPMLAPFQKRQTSDALKISGWEFPAAQKKRSTVGTLVDLNHALHKSIGYERREEGGARAPSETLRLGRGACRDVSVLLAEILREMGLAARLVSGYLRETDETKRVAEGSLHAWTETFLPGAGWVGLDPTNGIFCNENFITAAVGLEPAQITPIAGGYYHPQKIPAQMTTRLEFIKL